MKAMIGVLTELSKVRGKLTEKENRAVVNAICVLEKVDDLADAYDILERDSGNDEGN